MLREHGVAVVVPAGLEADDVLAWSAAGPPTVGARTVVVTSDRDAFALIDERTRVLRIINGGVEASPMLTPDLLALLLGIRPEQYPDFAALRGDPSDNLPGVRGSAQDGRSAARRAGIVRAALRTWPAGGARVAAAVGPARRPGWPTRRRGWPGS